MAEDFEARLRSPESYALARSALEQLEGQRVWPTPINYEIWAYVTADPDSPLAKELARLLEKGEAITEDVAENLASIYLPRQRLTEHIRDTGQALSRELASAEQAIRSAQATSETFSSRLEETSRSLGADPSSEALRGVVADLSDATRDMQAQNVEVERALAASTSEVAMLREQLQEVRKEAATDPLTRLANRRAFDEEIESVRSGAEATGEPFCLVLLDIDHFKKFNDTWGHQTGDQVLRYVAGIIRKRVSPPRFASRFGGEEFAFILPGENLFDASPLVSSILKDVSSTSIRRRSTNDNLGIITLSAGIAAFRSGESVHDLVERADTNLYSAKRRGRNRMVIESEI
jgi:diguanylate cyclase